MTVDARAQEPVTERRLETTADLDLRPTRELVELINDEDATVAGAVRAAAAPLSHAIEAVVERLERGGRLVYVGAGTSGRLAAADASELPATFGVAPGVVVAVVAEAEEIEDEGDAGAEAVVGAQVGTGDAVVALSASGRTPYVLGAIEAARSSGALTVGV